MNKIASGKDDQMKTVVVTGAARGIGLATSDLFLSEGWYVAMIDRDAEELEKVSEETYLFIMLRNLEMLWV